MALVFVRTHVHEHEEFTLQIRSEKFGFFWRKQTHLRITREEPMFPDLQNPAAMHPSLQNSIKPDFKRRMETLQIFIESASWRLWALHLRCCYCDNACDAKCHHGVAPNANRPLRYPFRSRKSASGLQAAWLGARIEEVAALSWLRRHAACRPGGLLWCEKSICSFEIYPVRRMTPYVTFNRYSCHFSYLGKCAYLSE